MVVKKTSLLFLLLGLLLAPPVHAQERGSGERTHLQDVVVYIHEVAPQVEAPRRRQLARGIMWVSRRFSLPPLLLAAIIRQESDFQPHTLACYLVRRHHSEEPTCDYGLVQINQVWVQKWGLDPRRLVEDDAYALFYGARVLAMLRREYQEEEPRTWWSRYNSSTPSSRFTYEAAVGPWLAIAEDLQMPLGQ